MSRPPVRLVVVTGLLVALLVAGVVSHHASSSPDGLERVATDHGFAGTAEEPAADSPFAGYDTRGVGEGRLSGGVAGVVGTLVVLGLAGGVFRLVRRRDEQHA